ncbi:GOLPH3/VPS74 family protein [Actinacidiphila yeochonensis]|uniref:GOLPH3/VPS74 family protein n=1 Tax=Actinacidiphila yeochonensis TaxID=89050 RepID=UPI0005686FB0|nr:GPP34 family phosphoprotein [Actinacidiphila yeochonensis]
MTTSRDLLIVTMDDAEGGPADPDDLSLALAGAELLDLIDAGAVALDGDVVVPGPPTTTGDSLLDQAASSLVRQEPYETVGKWLFRRGDRLSSAYLAALETEGGATRPRHRWVPVRADRPVLADSPARSHAAERWASGEPVLAVLAAAVGIPARPTGSVEPLADDEASDAGDTDARETVLAAVNHAVTQLEAVRQRRSVEDAAFDNIWASPLTSP